MKHDPETDRYLVRGLARGLQVMQAFTPERTEMSLSQIARQLGLSRSTVFRTVYTLHTLGFLLFDEDRQTYALGPAVLGLGHGYLATREVVEVARPELERLQNATGWSAHLGVLDGVSVLYAVRVSAQDGRVSIVNVGARLPARATSLGRILLAGLTDARIASLFRRAGGLGPEGMAALLRQAAEDRRRGTVVHLGDFEDGIAAVAAPVRDMTGEVVAAINVSAPTSEVGAGTVSREICDAVERSARRISTLMGESGA